MGHIKHHTIIVIGTRGNYVETARNRARHLFKHISPIVKSPCNGTLSFMIAPDGSKEGWADSDIGDTAREQFFNYIRSLAYSDGSHPLTVVEIESPEDAPSTCRDIK